MELSLKYKYKSKYMIKPFEIGKKKWKTKGLEEKESRKYTLTEGLFQLTTPVCSCHQHKVSHTPSHPNPHIVTSSTY